MSRPSHGSSWPNPRRDEARDGRLSAVLAPVLSADVADAVATGRPVVALESTIFSHLGLPSPANREAFDRCTAAIATAGAVPAVTAVLDGVARVGVGLDEVDRILGPGRKAAERDVPVAVAQGWEFGATTVSASVALAARAGVTVFATGGIGGVHRGAATTGDTSADLDALAAHPVVTVCAGAKAFLDLPMTLEYLETRGVPVLGWRHDWFPAFYTRSSGLPIPHRVESAAEVAAVLGARTRASSGVLLTVPIPEADELDPDTIDATLEQALADCERDGATGAAITPFVLGRIAEVTDGRSLPANIALAANNAAVAGEVAVALAQR
jgi:pseudouridine-5'-phosphate glycosidase